MIKGVVDFLRFLGKDPKSTYQRNKVLDFLKNLQDLPFFVEKLSEIEFRSSIMFPLLKLTKTHQFWIFTIAVGEQLYCYSYPFIFSNCFRDFQNKYALLVKLEIIKVLSRDSLKKKSSIRMFSENDKPLKLPLIRVRDRPRRFSLVIKNKKLARILRAILIVAKAIQIIGL